MEKRIVDYCVIKMAYAEGLNEKVLNELRAGWELFGTPFEQSGYICQAMIKRGYGRVSPKV